MKTTRRQLSRPSGRQRGAALAFVAVALVGLIAMAGLAIDIGRLSLSKTQLQSAVDAAALDAAKVLDQTGNTATATAAANTAFAANAQSYNELSAAAAAGLSVNVSISNTIDPFAAGSVPANYVRVVSTPYSIVGTFANAIGIASMETNASAVAGPSPTITSACNIAPLMVCGTPGVANFGYTNGALQVLKTASGNNASDYGVGPGNFQLIRVGGNGADVVRENLAGGYSGCVIEGGSLETQPGNAIGPVAQGLNTRFGAYSGSMSATDYPPDVVTDTPTPLLGYQCAPMGGACNIVQGMNPVTDVSAIGYSYAGNYLPDLSSGNYDNQPPTAGNGAFQRRELAVPIGDCSTTVNGQGSVPLLGVGCFFLLQPVTQQGNSAYVIGQFLSSCAAGGNPGPAPGAGPGPYIIQLYDDRASPDS